MELSGKTEFIEECGKPYLRMELDKKSMENAKNVFEEIDENPDVIGDFQACFFLNPKIVFDIGKFGGRLANGMKKHLFLSN